MIKFGFGLTLSILLLVTSCSVNDSNDEQEGSSSLTSSIEISSSTQVLEVDSAKLSSSELAVSSLVTLSSSSVLDSSSSSSLASSSSSKGLDTLGLSQIIELSSSSQGLPILRLTGNINADSEPLGSVIYTKPYLKKIGLDSPLGVLRNSKGGSINLGGQDGTINSVRLSMSVNGLTSIWDLPPQATISELINQINGFFGENSLQSRVSLTSNGSLEVKAIENLSKFDLQVDSPLAKSLFAQAFSFPSLINAGDLKYSDVLFVSAVPNDLLSELFDKQGKSLGLKVGDVITVDAYIGSFPLSDKSSLIYQSKVTTLQTLMDFIGDELKLPFYSMDGSGELSVSINRDGSDDNLPDGRIIVRGLPGKDYEIKSLSIKATASSYRSIPFNNNNSTTLWSVARAMGVYKDTVKAIDANTSASLFELETSIIYKNVGLYQWEVKPLGLDAEMISGGKGEIMAQTNGTFIHSGQYPTAGVVAISGHPNISFEIDFGVQGIVDPFENPILTHFEAPSDFTATWVHP